MLCSISMATLVPNVPRCPERSGSSSDLCWSSQAWAKPKPRARDWMSTVLSTGTVVDQGQTTVDGVWSHHVPVSPDCSSRAVLILVTS